MMSEKNEVEIENEREATALEAYEVVLEDKDATALITDAVPTDAVPTDAVPTDAVPTDAVPTVGGHKTAEQRIQEVLAQRYEAEKATREAEVKYIQALEELAQVKQANSEPKQKPVTRPIMPKDGDFDSDDAYTAAVGAYQTELDSYYDKKFDAKLATFTSNQAAQNQAADQQQAASDAFNKRQDNFAKTVVDYSKAVFTPDLKMHNAVIDYIKRADDGPQVAYYLGKNPEVASELLKLDPIMAVAKIGQLNILSNVNKATKNVSTAPAPINPLDGISTPGISTDLEKMPMADFMRQKRKEAWSI